MPHVGSSSAEDLASSDEIKVFKDEGEDEKRSSADLTDLKSSLITESDQVMCPTDRLRSDVWPAPRWSQPAIAHRIGCWMSQICAAATLCPTGLSYHHSSVSGTISKSMVPVCSIHSSTPSPSSNLFITFPLSLSRTSRLPMITLVYPRTVWLPASMTHTVRWLCLWPISLPLVGLPTLPRLQPLHSFAFLSQ